MKTLLKTGRLLALAAATALTSVFASAHAQDYPTRPITFIVPWNPGGNTDVVMRIVATAVGKELGQPLVVENRPGVSGTLGAGVMAQAKPDGYTIAQVSVPLVRLPLIQKMPWDPMADFTYIANIMGYVFGVVAGAHTPFNTWQDLIAYAKAHPGEVSYATPGQYSTPHLGMEQIAELTGINWLHVPYKGGPEANTAVAGGHVHLQANATNWKPLLDGGTARLLALWSAERRPQWPDVPTLTEVGIPLVIDSPLGIAGPKGMDGKIVARLAAAFRVALETPEVKQAMVDYDMFPNYMGPDAYRRFMTELQQQERAQLSKMGIELVK